MNILVATARVAFPDPDPVVAEMCLHFEDHGALFEKEGNTYILPLGLGQAKLVVDDDGIDITVEAEDIDGIHQLRWTIAEHLIEYAEDASREVMPEINWTGAGSNLVIPPNCREIEVVAVKDIPVHMRRITFKADDLERFDTQDDHHIQLLLPRKKGVEPEWAHVGPDGILKHAKGERAPLSRVYTIRKLDRAVGTVDIDFVLHEHAGPASSFAKQAQPGDVIRMVGPLAGSIPLNLGWYLLACDETGIPELARTLENLPEQAQGVAFIEVDGAGDKQEIVTNSGVETRWLYRNGTAPGTTTLLADAVRATEIPSDNPSIYVWAAGEFAMFRAVKTYLRDERGLRRDQHLVAAYWRRGKVERETV